MIFFFFKLILRSNQSPFQTAKTTKMCLLGLKVQNFKMEVKILA